MRFAGNTGKYTSRRIFLDSQQFLSKLPLRPRMTLKTFLKLGRIMENLISVSVELNSGMLFKKTLTQTLKDSPERMYWRSKQSMDYAFIFHYCQGLSQYYLHLEDDVTAEPNYMRQIRDFVARQGDAKWDVLTFSGWGFIGKLFQDKDLRKFARYITMFYNEMPVDWLLYLYSELQAGQSILGDKEHKGDSELFHHIGHQSSSLGT